nr:MAG TPA: hypothetical protein [Caudoviricetes sp.]DAP24494.1 MAG TPA: hypothetical protein [Caudoviricetes sp.]
MDKTYLGRRLADFSPGIASKPITKVELLDENGDVVGVSGSDTGRTLTALQPDGTNAMAAAILAKVSGYKHIGYDGRKALLDPAVEIGDAVTVDGHYVPLIALDMTFDPLLAPDISAPDADEIDDEYPYKSPTQRQIERNFAKARSLITKTSEEIMLKVEGIDGKYTEVKTTLDGLTVTDQSGTTKIKGSSIETGSIAAKSINADKLNLTGAITFGDLDANAQNSINTANNNASTAITAAGNAQAAANGAVQKVSAWEYPGSTYIDGSKIMTGTVMATKLLGGTVGLLASDESIVGALNLAYTTTGIGLGILTSQGGIQIQSAGNLFLSAGTGGNITVQSGRVQLGSAALCLASASYGYSAPSGAGVDGQLYIQLVT